jgi:cytochrome c-type biogenesis protein CcmH/NrfF
MRPEPAPGARAGAPGRRASGRRRAVLLLAGLAVAAAAPARHARAADLTPQQRVEAGMMCYCGCANLTVRSCTCGTADAIRAEIASRLGAGETPDQVLAAFVARHGEKILSAPTDSGFNLLAWTMPFAAILAAGVVLVVLVRRWERAGAGARTGPDAGGPPAAAAPAGTAAAAGDEALRDRVRREIESRL